MELNTWQRVLRYTPSSLDDGWIFAVRYMYETAPDAGHVRVKTWPAALGRKMGVIERTEAGVGVRFRLEVLKVTLDADGNPTDHTERVRCAPPGTWDRAGAVQELLDAGSAKDFLFYWGTDLIKATYDLAKWPAMQAAVADAKDTWALPFLPFLRVRPTVAPAPGGGWTLLIELVPVPGVNNLALWARRTIEQRETTAADLVRRSWCARARSYFASATDGPFADAMAAAWGGLRPALAEPRMLFIKAGRGAASCERVGWELLKMIALAHVTGRSGTTMVTSFGTRVVKGGPKSGSVQIRCAPFR